MSVCSGFHCSPSRGQVEALLASRSQPAAALQSACIALRTLAKAPPPSTLAATAPAASRGGSAADGPKVCILSCPNGLAQVSAECAAVAGLRKVGWKRAGLSLQSRPLQLSAVDKSPLRGAWVCLHVRSAAAAYGDLGKTRVTPSRALTKAIAAAVEQALREP